MTMYGIATLPCCSQTGSIEQNWYAAGGSAAGKLANLEEKINGFFLSRLSRRQTLWISGERS